jgi:hypothetical protein
LASFQVQGANELFREYDIKAGLIYKLATFAEWPESKKSSDEFIIGIIGKNPFGNILDSLQGKNVNNKKVVLKWFQSLHELKESDSEDERVVHPDANDIRKCNILFICRSEQKELAFILNIIKESHVFTVGDMKGFLEAGGIFNFVIHEDKVRFEINCIAARQANLTIRSRLLRSALRLIE